MANKKRRQSTSGDRGFSMIEMLVAMALFIVAIAITIGIFLQALKINRTALSLAEANDNLLIAMEEISRSIRQGIGFVEGTDNESVEFIDVLTANTIRYEYVEEEGAIYKEVIRPEDAAPGPPESPSVSGAIKITPDTVKIGKFKIVKMANSNPSRITVKFEASPVGKLESNVTRVQTTISSRYIE